MKKAAYVLDSYALLAYFFHEASSERVAALLSQSMATASLFISLLSCGEIYYRVCIQRNEGLARKAYADIKRLPIKVCWPTETQVLAAATLKAEYRLPYLDSFVAAVAIEKSAVVVTGDADFRRVESLVKLEWLGS